MKIFSPGTILLMLTASFMLSAEDAEPGNMTIPKSVNAAELEGASHHRGELPSNLGFGFESGGAEGTSQRKCVEFPVGVEPADRRSGEIIVGGSIGALKADKPGKVWWAPLHDPAVPKFSLVVRAARMDAVDKTSLFTSKNYAWPIAGNTVLKEHAFFPSGYSLPDAGRWLLTVTSGNDWGCFIVIVR